MMQRLRYIIAVLYIACLQNINAQETQNIAIKGAIKDKKDGSGLPGVNVIIKGTTNGTVTDLDGNFSIKVPSKETVIQISSIGYKTQEIVVGDNLVFDINLEEDSKVLEDVVVTAVAIKREKRELGYSVQELKQADINNSQETNIVNAISSKAAGVQVISSSGSPGAAARIRIRGNSSLTQNNDPLFVIDGIPIDNTGGEATRTLESSNRAIDMNPNDIESMTILKGPAATALYGIRAANGAIIITTKKGKAGKVTVNFSSSFGVDVVNKLPGIQNKFAGGNNSIFAPFDIRNDNQPFSTSGTGNSRSWGPSYDSLRYDGLSSKWDSRGDIIQSTDPSLARVTPYDNLNNFLQPAIRTDNYASVSGGTEKSTFFLSIGNFRQNGVIPKQLFERNSVKFTATNQINKMLKATASANYTYSEASRMRKGGNWGSPWVSLLRSPNDFDFTNGNSNAVNDPSAYQFADGTQRKNAIFDNPYFAVNNNVTTEKINRLIGLVQLDFQPLSWLNIMGRVGTDISHFGDRQNYSKFSAENHNEDSYVGSLRIAQTLRRDLNTDLLVSADKDLNKDWNIGVRVGHNFWQSSKNINEVTGQQYVISNVENIENTVVKESYVYSSERQLMALYLDSKIGFRNYAFLNFTYRREEASTLPKNNQVFSYPSLSLSLVFTDMLKMENNPVLSFGKIRASVAQVGNLPNPYLTNTYFESGLGTNNFKGQILYQSQGVQGNPNFKPEVATTLEFGTELRFFKNRFVLDVTYYDTQNKNQIVNIQAPASAGYAQAWRNSGYISNKGWEIMAGVTPVKKAIQWDVSVNFTRYRNFVYDVATQFQPIGGSAGFTQGYSSYANGYQYGVIVGTSRIKRYGQDPNDRSIRSDLPMVVDSTTGLPVLEVGNFIVGNPNPDWFAGIRNTVSYKGWSLSGLLDIKQGGDMFNLTKLNMQAMGTHETTEDRREFKPLENSVFADGRPNNISIYKNRAYYENFGGDFGNAPERGIEDASWVRVREVVLRYSFTKKVTDYLKMQALSLSFSGRNLFLFTPYTGVDPESNAAGNDPSFGRDAYNMPNTRSFVGSLNVTF